MQVQLQSSGTMLRVNARTIIISLQNNNAACRSCQDVTLIYLWIFKEAAIIALNGEAFNWKLALLKWYSQRTPSSYWSNF